MTVEPSYRIHIGATNRPDIGVVHDGMSLKEAMTLVPEGDGLRIMEGVNGSILFGVPDTRLQDIADADLAPVATLVSELCDLIKSRPVAFNSFQWASRFRNRVLALDALTEGNDDE